MLMKLIKNLVLAIVAIVGATALVMCVSPKSDSNKKEDGGITNFEVQQVFKQLSKSYICLGSDSVYDGSNIYGEITTSVQWPVKIGNNNINVLQDSLLAKAFDKPKSTIDSTMYNYALNPECLSEFKIKEVKTIPYTDAKTRVWSNSVNVLAQSMNENFAVYRIEYSSFLGGAHPNSNETYINYDIKNNKILSYNDIFKKDSDGEIEKLIEAELCSMYNATNVKSLVSDTGIDISSILTSKSIYLSQDNIVFFYNPYEIGCYAMGAIRVKLSIWILNMFLTPEGKSLYPRLS